jgi:uncharacterized RDD family membrane protein YckC
MNPYKPPEAPVGGVLQADPALPDDVEYVGFWARVGAAIIDSILILLVTFPLLLAFYGWAYFDTDQSSVIAGPADVLISWVLPIAATVAFWLYRQATPGKMAIGARVVDAETGATLSIGQAIGRYVGYLVSTIPLGLGLLWVAFDRRKQGWHDKLARTVVVRTKRAGASTG